MAQLIVRPTVVDFLDLAMQARELGLCMEELLVTAHTSFVNTTLMKSGLRSKYDIIVVAIKRPDIPMIFNPGPNTEIQQNDILIVLGDNQQISALERPCRGRPLCLPFIFRGPQGHGPPYPYRKTFEFPQMRPALSMHPCISRTA